MIAAAIKVFNNETVTSYINKAYKAENSKSNYEFNTLVHICTAHFMNQIMRRLPKKNTKLKHFVKNAVLKIIYSSNFDEQEILYKNLITVLCYKNNCKQTIMAKSNLSTNPVTFDFEEVNETVMEENFEIISANSPNKDKVSAYYQKIKKITDDVIEKGNTLKTQHKNNLYKPEFVQYFIEYCIPIMPLWSNTLVRKANVELKQEEQLIITNATVESTFAYEKKYVF
ncbi:UNVERIFIED_CONTAM: hypothetical protein RMT77_017568 [Armadillidium vulgare]